MTVQESFNRPARLWLGYGLMALFGFALSLLGPLMPFLAEHLGMNYSEMGYHFTALSAGVLVTSMSAERIVRRIGYRRAVILGMLLLLLGLPGMVYGPSIVVTLLSAFVYGFGIGMVAQGSNAIIASTAGPHAAKAYTEGNIIGGTALFVGPLLVGLLAGSALGWQTVIFLPPIFMIVLLVLFRGLPVPASPQSGRQNDPAPHVADGSLPHLYWVFGALLFLAVAIEWLITSWGTSFLNTVVGFEASTAAMMLSVFPLAMVLGRLAGRRLLDLLPESRVLMLSLLWVLLAFPIYWLSTLPLLNVLGLFLIGLGVGNLAPLSMSAAMLAGSGAQARASARLALFPSTANLTMLPLVGVLSDSYGIQRAYSVEILVILVAFAVAMYANRARATRAVPQT